MRAPDFWRTDNPLARLLGPIGHIMGGITARRATRAPLFHAPVPVICVGNLTAGGTGKTPVAASIAAQLKDRGLAPAVLMRGYGGRLKGPVRVDLHNHAVADVGDEAMLHARNGPTWVAHVRAEGGRAAADHGADIIVMDDGHQHASLAKDLSIIVVDGRKGFGNGRMLPAGPLREPIAGGLARADVAVVMGEDPKNLSSVLAERLPVLRAHLAPSPAWLRLRGQRVVAFAGIGDPEKFYYSLAAVGAQIAAFHPFDDHYAFDATDIQPILDEAYSLGALTVTTAKDAVRLDPDQRQQVNVLDIDVTWEAPERLDMLLDQVLAKKR